MSRTTISINPMFEVIYVKENTKKKIEKKNEKKKREINLEIIIYLKDSLVSR